MMGVLLDEFTNPVMGLCGCRIDDIDLVYGVYCCFIFGYEVGGFVIWVDYPDSHYV